MRFLSILALLVFCATFASAETFLGRSYRLTDARPDPSIAAPLVIAMHGFLGTSRSMNRKTGFDRLAAKHGFVVVYPNGQKRSWNDGRNPANQTDDVGYLKALIGQLVKNGVADPSQIYLAGHSNGGGMAMRMACDAPDLIAGVAIAATKVPLNYQCVGGSPVPAIFFHGTVDPIAPHAGRPQGHRLGGTLSADNSIRLWSSRNKCQGQGAVQTVDRQNDGTQAQIIQYRGCRAPLAHVVIEGHGHSWPGSAKLPRLQGPATKEVDAAALSWWFFSQIE